MVKYVGIAGLNFPSMTNQKTFYSSQTIKKCKNIINRKSETFWFVCFRTLWYAVIKMFKICTRGTQIRYRNRAGSLIVQKCADMSK